MKLHSKKLISLILAVVLVLGIFPMAGFAVEGEEPVLAQETPGDLTTDNPSSPSSLPLETPSTLPPQTPAEETPSNLPVETPSTLPENTATPTPTPTPTPVVVDPSTLSGEELYAYLLTLEGDALKAVMAQLTEQQVRSMEQVLTTEQLSALAEKLPKEEMQEKTYGTPAGLYVNGALIYGQDLLNYLFSIGDEQAFMDAVNAMDIDQSGSLEGLVTDEQAASISGAIRHAGFAVSSSIAVQRRSFAKSFGIMSVTEPEWPNPGAILLDKYATKVAGTTNQWQVTLKIDGKNIQTSSDVVLVIDRSGSMVDNRSTKLADTKTAAMAFVNQLMTSSNSNVRIAVVSFADGSTQNIGLTDYSNKQSILNAIDTLTGGGGTNIQSGLYKARNILSSSTADKKSIVLLGDGYPTFSNKVTGATGITYEHTDGWYRTGWDWQYGHYIHDINTSSAVITACDYSTQVGNGSDYSLSRSQSYTITCSHGTSASSGFPSNNGTPTIYEAGLAKSTGTGIDLYTVGLQVDSTGASVLQACATDASKYYSIAQGESNITSRLQAAFTAIAGSIANAATDAVVTDPLGDMFDRVESIQISTSQGSASITNRIITWDVGTIQEGVTATMTYRLVLKEGADANVLYPTNGTTILEYTNYQGDDTSSEFPIPEVSVDKGSIIIHMYRVNETGQPINSFGIVVDYPYQAQELGEPYNFTYNGADELVYSTYSVGAPTITDYTAFGYVVDTTNSPQGSITTGSPASVIINSAAPTKHVFFGYYEDASNCALTLVKTGWESADANASFLFTISGPNGTFHEVIQGNGQKTIAGLPKGPYTITEDTDWSWRYTQSSITLTASSNATINGSTVTFSTGNATATVTIDNHRDNPFWLSGEDNAINKFDPYAG